MMGRITLENGTEAVFFLAESEVELLEKEAAEFRVLNAIPSYKMTDELVQCMLEGIRNLKKLRGRKDETPGEVTPGVQGN